MTDAKPKHPFAAEIIKMIRDGDEEPIRVDHAGMSKYRFCAECGGTSSSDLPTTVNHRSSCPWAKRSKVFDQVEAVMDERLTEVSSLLGKSEEALTVRGAANMSNAALESGADSELTYPGSLIVRAAAVLGKPGCT